MDRSLLSIVERETADASADLIADGLWCLRLPLPYALPRTVNVFLFDTADGQLLVDCGTNVGVGWDGLAHALSLANSEPSRISTLLCTHLHTDHSAMASIVVERIGCKYLQGVGPGFANDVFREQSISYAERRVLALRAGVPDQEMDLMIDAFMYGEGTEPYPTVDGILADGDPVATDVGLWEVITVPGHSPNQIALYEPRRKWLISADVAFLTGRPYIEYGHTPDPFAEHLNSIDRLAALPVDLLFPGHGAPDPAPLARFRTAREETLAWQAEVRGHLEPAGNTPYEVTCAIAGHDPDPDRRQMTLSVVMCVLSNLLEMGEVAETTDGDVQRFTPLW